MKDDFKEVVKDEFAALEDIHRRGRGDNLRDAP